MGSLSGKPGPQTCQFDAQVVDLNQVFREYRRRTDIEIEVLGLAIGGLHGLEVDAGEAYLRVCELVGWQYAVVQQFLELGLAQSTDTGKFALG